jgi:ABC-type nitrate/sulfonate/bicarbonate transport system permease component
MKAPSRLMIRLLLPLAILLGWKLAVTYGNISPIILPKIESVGRDFIRYTESGELWRHVLVSLQRCFTGYAVGAIVGVALGILMAWFQRLGDLFDFLINFFRAVPKTALAPLLIVWFGFGDFPKVLLIALASFFYTLVPTIEGAQNVDKLLIKAARSMGANNRQVLFGVIFPAALPSIYAGLRIAATSSFVVLVFVEIISGNSGLGYLLEDARESLNTSTMFMTLIVVGILGFLLDWVVRYSERKVMPWQHGRTLSR